MDREKHLEDKYRHGQCYPMAAALHDALGWPIRTLTALRDEGNKRPHPAHSWVVAPDGRALDAGGFHDENDLVAEFLDGREQVTLDSAETITSDTAEDYFETLMDLSGGTADFIEGYREYFGKAREEANHVARNYVLPRFDVEMEDGAPSP